MNILNVMQQHIQLDLKCCIPTFLIKYYLCHNCPSNGSHMVGKPLLTSCMNKSWLPCWRFFPSWINVNRYLPLLTVSILQDTMFWKYPDHNNSVFQMFLLAHNSGFQDIKVKYLWPVYLLIYIWLWY